MEPVVLAVLVGIAVYVLVVALIPKRFISEVSYTQSQLQKLEAEMGVAKPAENRDSIFRDQMHKTGFMSRAFFALPLAKRTYPMLLKAGLADSVDMFVTVWTIILVMLILLLAGKGVLGVAIAFSAVYMGGWIFINYRIKKRNLAFLQLFPDALDMIVRSVRSGHPLNAAVRIVAQNMEAPLSTEFKQVADETNYGSSLIDALQRLSQRIDEPDIRFFVVVLSVQQEVGGNLAEVLSNLSGIIRKRKHLRLKIKALTSEGRATAWVLGLLPAFEFAAIHMVSPGHLTPLFDTPLGNMVLLTAIGIVLLGMFIVRQMINIEL